MKIKTEHNYIVDVFAIYWRKSLADDCVDTYFYGLPKGNGGLSVYRLGDDAEVVDPNLSGNFIYLKEGIFHKAMIEEDLLEDLLEYDETAYNRFLEILKAEGQIDSDFY